MIGIRFNNNGHPPGQFSTDYISIHEVLFKTMLVYLLVFSELKYLLSIFFNVLIEQCDDGPGAKRFFSP